MGSSVSEIDPGFSEGGPDPMNLQAIHKVMLHRWFYNASTRIVHLFRMVHLNYCCGWFKALQLQILWTILKMCNACGRIIKATNDGALLYELLANSWKQNPSPKILGQFRKRNPPSRNPWSTAEVISRIRFYLGSLREVLTSQKSHARGYMLLLGYFPGPKTSKRALRDLQAWVIL